MLSKDTDETLSNRCLEGHYLGALLKKVPLSPFWIGVSGGLVSYTLFLLLVPLGHWRQVTTTFLHVWQLSLSVTLFLGLWLGYYAIKGLGDWLGHVRVALRLSEADFSGLVEASLRELGSPRSSLVAAPFIAAAAGISYVIVRNSPNDLFPFPAYVPAFLYTLFLELSFLMMHQLGATGFWLLYVFTTTARRLGRLESANYGRIDEESMMPLGNIVLRLCFFLLVIISSAMPCVAYVVFSFRQFPIVLALGIVWGLALPTLGLILSFFGPTYYLHKVLCKAKDDQLRFLKGQIEVCEGMIHERVSKMTASNPTSLPQDGEKLLAVSRFLRERLTEARNRSVWPFNLSTIVKLSASGMLPIVTFFAKEILQRLMA